MSRRLCSVFLCLLFLTLSGCAGDAPNTTISTPQGVQQEPRARITYVAIGASDTFGIGTDDPLSQSWPSDLAGYMGKNVRLVNLGIPDIHAHEAINIELPVAIDAHPDLVTVWLAVNDLADNVPLDSYEHDLDTLLTRLQKASPHVHILVANVPDLVYVPHFRSYNVQLLHAQIAAYNTVIANVVARHHVILVDLFQSWQELATHPEYISSDGFHPNAIGYSRIAQIFYQVVRGNNL